MPVYPNTLQTRKRLKAFSPQKSLLRFTPRYASRCGFGFPNAL